MQIKTKLIFMVFFAIYSTSALAFKNEPLGFRGAKWGMNISSNPQMILKSSKKYEKVYIRKDDKLSIGNAKLKRLVYFTYKDKFSSVLITTKGIANRRALIDAFQANFGKGYKPNKYINEYLWEGSTSTVFITCNSFNKTCTATIGSTLIANKKKNDAKEAAKAAGSDF
ncbi:MAG: hypothetical protein BMS9Abin36_1158 [Gammaproteobacteria bacterium]|nr:MAG: hypothetical protein BMS9Abin36_1158 [Gammaproteobacteria bacterium]